MSMNAATGRAITTDEHLAQSIAIILTTPIGTRVMRRDFGSLLVEMIDQPADPRLGNIRAFAAIATALAKWEPRLRLRRVDLIKGDKPGRFLVDLTGERTDRPAPSSLTRLRVPILTRAALPLTV